jgi:hypothetical protein
LSLTDTASPVIEELAALRARLQELEDKEAIRELFNRYGFSADSGEAKIWSETWAKDGVMDVGKYQTQGREAFFNSIEDPNSVHKTEIEGRGSLHTTGPLTIRIKGDVAWAEAWTMVWVRDGAAWRVYVAAYNHWDLAKTDGRWEVTLRKARAVGPGNAAKVLQAYKTAD